MKKSVFAMFLLLVLFTPQGIFSADKMWVTKDGKLSSYQLMETYDAPPAGVPADIAGEIIEGKRSEFLLKKEKGEEFVKVFPNTIKEGIYEFTRVTFENGKWVFSKPELVRLPIESLFFWYLSVAIPFVSMFLSVGALCGQKKGGFRRLHRFFLSLTVSVVIAITVGIILKPITWIFIIILGGFVVSLWAAVDDSVSSEFTFWCWFISCCSIGFSIGYLIGQSALVNYLLFILATYLVFYITFVLVWITKPKEQGNEQITEEIGKS